MNIEEAEWCHNELRENLPGPAGDARDALDDVIQQHGPMRDGRRAACRTCVQWNEDRAPWPCMTISLINAYAHIDGIPAGREAHNAAYDALMDS